MQIRPVSSEEELAEVYGFVARNLELGAQHPRGLGYYLGVFASHPTLLLWAGDDGGTCVGALLASVESDHVLIGEVVVVAAARGLGVGSALLAVVEEHTRTLGHETILVGAREDAEAFYLRRSGYEPQLLVQVDGEDSRRRITEMIDATNVPVAWRRIVGNQVTAIIKTVGVDKALQERINAAGDHTQYLFRKSVQ